MKETQTNSESRKISNLLKQYPLLSFFVLSYAITWLIFIFYFISSKGLLPFKVSPYFLTLGNFGPAVAAVTVAWVTGGKSGIRELLKQLTNWRVSIKWYIVALLLPTVINGSLMGLYSMLTDKSPELGFNTWLTLIPTVLFWMAFGGPLGEEIGWRGYALPKLQANYSPLTSSFILGAAWIGWHLPRYLDPQIAGGGFAVIIVFTIQAMACSILFTWLYNKTNSSLLLLVLFHAAFNTPGYIVPILFPTATASDMASYGNLISLLLLGIYVVWSIVVALAFMRNKPSHKSAAFKA